MEQQRETLRGNHGTASFALRGHLIDDQILSQVLDAIARLGGDRKSCVAHRRSCSGI
ncbi:MAG: hypothetical protein R2864_13110 [Syntrophotaleaceae bacterium]